MGNKIRIQNLKEKLGDFFSQQNKILEGMLPTQWLGNNGGGGEEEEG